MKRFYWIEITLILASFTALVNYLDFLSIALMALSVILLLIVNKSFILSRVMSISIILDILMYYLASFGGLFNVYPSLKVLLVLLSIHLALLSEILNYKALSKHIIEPFCIYTIIAFIFMVLAILLKDSTIFNNMYPYGVISLLTLIMIIFMPYLTTTTLTLMLQEYNK